MRERGVLQKKDSVAPSTEGPPSPRRALHIDCFDKIGCVTRLLHK